MKRYGVNAAETHGNRELQESGGGTLRIFLLAMSVRPLIGSFSRHRSEGGPKWARGAARWPRRCEFSNTLQAAEADLLCCPLATKFLFLHRNRTFQFTPFSRWL